MAIATKKKVRVISVDVGPNKGVPAVSETQKTALMEAALEGLTSEQAVVQEKLITDACEAVLTGMQTQKKEPRPSHVQVKVAMNKRFRRR